MVRTASICEYINHAHTSNEVTAWFANCISHLLQETKKKERALLKSKGSGGSMGYTVSLSCVTSGRYPASLLHSVIYVGTETYLTLLGRLNMMMPRGGPGNARTQQRSVNSPVGRHRGVLTKTSVPQSSPHLPRTPLMHLSLPSNLVSWRLPFYR